MQKWILAPPRQRHLPESVYTAIILVEGTQNSKQPGIVIWGPNPMVLQQIVNEHNELLTLKNIKPAPVITKPVSRAIPRPIPYPRNIEKTRK